MKPAIVATILSLFLFCGCVFTKVTPVSGTYVGSECAGWTMYFPRRAAAGQVYKAPYTGKGMPPSTSIYKAEKGVLSIGITYPKFPKLNKITVTFNDLGNRKELEIDGSDVEVPVGDSEDFTVTMPGYTQGDITVPTFEARFRWSNKPVRRYDYVGP